MRNEIAQTILQQLGGNKFVAMTGAYNLTACENALIFRIKGCNKVNGVKITLDPSDTYTMTFYKQKGAPTFEVKTVNELKDVYCDQLQEIFTSETGLYTYL